VVETPFGWHVIRLVERVPEQRMPLETRRLAFAEEVYVRRARASTLARLEDQRVSAPVTILASAENLMRSVSSAGAGPAP
jgi:parvulin-like peptidyl-prolyl isomerase